MIGMRNALPIIFGSNLGTTLSNWLVVALGFKFNIQSISLPVIAVAGAGLVIFSNGRKIKELFRFSMGFGLLFLGLDFMKQSMEVPLTDFSFGAYVHLTALGFVVADF